jgi:hypothetical protein
MRSRPTQYEDLPIEIRNLIIRKLREAREAAALVFQKYTRGRVPHLVYKRSKYVWRRVDGIVLQNPRPVSRWLYEIQWEYICGAFNRRPTRSTGRLLQSQAEYRRAARRMLQE